MINRENPYTTAESNSIKKIIIKNKNKLAIVVTSLVTIMVLSGCGKSLPENIAKTYDDIPESTISWEVDGEYHYVRYSDNATIKDEGIRNAIEHELGTSEYTYEDLINIRKLFVDETKDIDSIKFLPSLQELSISNSSINDISSISNIKTIRYLTVDNCKNITDLSSIKNMNLKMLHIENMNIDLSFLKGMNLESLYIRNTPVSEEALAIIGEMTSLKNLTISESNIKDLDALNKLSLENLHIDNNMISSVDSINGTNIKTLDLRNGAVSNIDLTKYPNLTSICVQSNYALYTQDLLNYCQRNNINIDIEQKDIDLVNQVRTIMAGLELEGKSVSEKEVIIYKYVVSNIEYDKKNTDEQAMEYNQNGLYWALQGRGVCANYATLFDCMCDLAGIKSYYISGYGKTSAFSGGFHAWNLVEIDGSYYFCDPTWSKSFQESLEFKILSHVVSIEKLDKNYNETEGKFTKKHIEHTSYHEERQVSRTEDTQDEIEVMQIVETGEKKELPSKLMHGILTGSVVAVGAGAMAAIIHKKKEEEKRRKREQARKRAEARRKASDLLY